MHGEALTIEILNGEEKISTRGGGGSVASSLRIAPMIGVRELENDVRVAQTGRQVVKR